MPLKSQEDSTGSPGPLTRKILVGSVAATSAGVSLIYLNNAWYRQYQTSQFHFFNDNNEWQQADKAGHVYSSYQVGRLMMDAFEWAGFKKKWRLAAGGTGLIYLTAIEVMDGFSSGWGFSLGDEIANLSGAAIAVAQEAAWGEQRINLKFSYRPSAFAKYNPSLLGETQYYRIIKDYNAQTYWMSCGPSTFTKRRCLFPRWLSVAVGYKAFGMTGGHGNSVMPVDENGNAIVIERQREFFLSLDVDLTKIKTRSKFLGGLFSVINVLKIPAPAIGVGSHGLKFYPLYY